MVNSDDIPNLTQDQGNKILDLVGTNLDRMNPDDDIYWEVKEIKNLWFKYGNNSDKHTYSNHRFIQTIINGNYDSENYDVDADCKRKVDARLVNILKILLGKDNPDDVDPYCEDINDMIKEI